MDGKSTPGYSSAGESGQESPRQRLGISDEEFRAMGEIGGMYYRQGSLQKAQTIFEGMVELDPESAAAHAALGALLTRTERFDDALRHLDRAVELAPEMIAPYVNRAEIFIKRQEAERAVENLKRAVELDPKEIDPAANRARAMALGIAEALRARGVGSPDAG
ncbi:MAG TPA: tetratricopeptide repeat protein [Pyrinomonadaceae bacterium]|nr:tetratricopeptide repeat protein [Pyrinomonadaceae bacterium]